MLKLSAVLLNTYKSDEYTNKDSGITAYFTLFFHPFHSQPSTFLSLKQACKIVA